MRKKLPVLVGVGFALLAGAAAAQDPAQRQVKLAIERQTLADALAQWAQQTGLQLISTVESTSTLDAPRLSGTYTAQDALDRLLSGTSLTYVWLNERTVAVRERSSQTAASWQSIANDGTEAPIRVARLAASAEPASTSNQSDAKAPRGKRVQTRDPIAAPDSIRGDLSATRGIPEILVVGSKILNTDIRRSEDDPQPYVVFDAQEIRRSQSSNVEEFFKTRLPMNTVGSTHSQSADGGVASSINLRGLGANQTLILVDGRRMPNINLSGGFEQPDINGIPLFAIERIEVLPTTASGIYGGGATGGAINIITRKDYEGVEFSATYGSPFSGHAPNYRVDGGLGMNFDGGRTHFGITASHADSDPLLSRDRNFANRGRNLAFANNPSAFLDSPTPPVGYTTNVRSEDGSDLQLDPAFGGTNLNSPRTFVPTGYAGPATDGGAGLVANAGQYNLAIPADLFSGRRGLLFGSEVDSANLNLRHRFGERVEAYADLSWLENDGTNFFSVPPNSVTLPADAPNNPFTTAVNVSFPGAGLTNIPSESRSESRRATAGTIVRLPRDWTASADYTWSRAKQTLTSTITPVGDPDEAGPAPAIDTALSDGTLDVMRDLNAFPFDWSPYLLPRPGVIFGPSETTVNQASARLSGPLLHLPGGPLVLSGLLEWREEKAADEWLTLVFSNVSNLNLLYPARSQSVVSAYLETRAPLISAANALPFARNLELQASVRHDDYETRVPSPGVTEAPTRQGPFPELTQYTNSVSATKYTLGLRFVPVQDLALRASYGTGFLPPSISQISPSFGTNSSFFVDPKRGSTRSRVTYDFIADGSPDLDPEESKSWSVGAVFAPRMIEGLRLSVDYTRIKKVNEITSFSAQQLLNFEDLLPGRVTRAPLTPADAALGHTGGVITSFDLSALNLAASRLDAYDLQGDYTFETNRSGTFHLYVVATYQPTLERKTAPNASFLDSAGFNRGVLEWRGNAGLTWERGPLTLGWSAQYYDSYFVYAAGSSASTIAIATADQGAATVSSQTYHDAFIQYRFDDFASGNVLSDTEIALGIQNVFDKSPPILATIDTFGGYSTYGDPRLRRFSLTVRKKF